MYTRMGLRGGRESQWQGVIRSSLLRFFSSSVDVSRDGGGGGMVCL